MCPDKSPIKSQNFLVNYLSQLEVRQKILSFSVPSLGGVFLFKVKGEELPECGRGVFYFDDHSKEEALQFFIMGRELRFLYELQILTLEDLKALLRTKYHPNDKNPKAEDLALESQNQKSLQSFSSEEKDPRSDYFQTINQVMIKYQNLQNLYFYEQKQNLKVIEKITEENSLINRENANLQALSKESAVADRELQSLAQGREEQVRQLKSKVSLLENELKNKETQLERNNETNQVLKQVYLDKEKEFFHHAESLARK